MRDISTSSAFKTIQPYLVASGSMDQKQSVASASPWNVFSDILPLAKSSGHEFGDYILMEKIGEGAFAPVFRARDSRTGDIVAVKKISKATIMSDEKLVIRVLREITITQKLKEIGGHPNVVDFKDVFQTEDSVVIIMEMINGGELYDLIVGCNKISENDARQYFSQLSAALNWLHSLGICHRDIKAENILLAFTPGSRVGKVKIIDFGLATFMDAHDTDSHALSFKPLETYCGSLAYLAPQMLMKKPYSGRLLDAFAAGVVLHMMLTGQMPFDESLGVRKLLFAQVNNSVKFPDSLSSDAKDVIRGLLKCEENQRYSLDMVLTSPWMLQHTLETENINVSNFHEKK